MVMPISARRWPTRLLVAVAIISTMAFALNAGHAAGQAVNVFYAGSLVNLNEQLIGPAFATASGYTYQGQSAGSTAIANQIKGKLATPDVVEFADAATNKLLMGDANGNYISWYLTFATSPLVIGFDPRSRVAPLFRQVQRRRLPWYRALRQPGLRMGRTDPNLDPKGYRALWMARLAQRVFHLKRFERTLFGAPENPAQVFPEQVLVSRMLTGQVNVGVFYLSEVRALGIPYITLPARINLGSPRYARLYATQRFTTGAGQTVRGAPIRYTITIPGTATNPTGAEAFVRFVLSGRVRTISARRGLLPLRVTAGGDRRVVPASLRPLLGR